MEIECDQRKGRILEVEEKVKPSDPRFAAKVKVSEEVARASAAKRHAGQVTDVEYELEPGDKASYEFDIVTAEGREWKVEVDVTSGEIVEDNEELFQIGQE